MSAAGHKNRGSRVWARRRPPTGTLVLLDYPDENELVGKPIEAVSPPAPTERRGRRAFAIAAGVVVVATGSIVGGSIAFDSGENAATTTLRAPAPGPLILPKFQGTNPNGAPTGTARQPRRTSPASPRPSVSATVASQPAAAQPSTAAAQRSTTAEVPALAVTYVVDNAWSNGFQGEVKVTNHGTTAISGWKIAVAVPQDRFSTWWNATGGVSNGILSMNQPSWSGPLEPGQTLHAYFNATGNQTSPTVCTFNGIACARS